MIVGIANSQGDPIPRVEDDGTGVMLNLTSAEPPFWGHELHRMRDRTDDVQPTQKSPTVGCTLAEVT